MCLHGVGVANIEFLFAVPSFGLFVPTHVGVAVMMGMFILLLVYRGGLNPE